MNRSSIRSVLLASSFLLAISVSSAAPAVRGKAGQPGADSAGKNGVNFERTKSRINSLLTQRVKPDPLPDPLPNPFVLSVAAPVAVTHEKDPKAGEGLAPGSDSEMLVYYGAMLKISGTVRINDLTHLVINQAPYKEGDIFSLKTKDATVKLRVIGIAPGELTLGLNDAVQVIKFKK
jgi:hypothetical protein